MKKFVLDALFQDCPMLPYPALIRTGKTAEIPYQTLSFSIVAGSGVEPEKFKSWRWRHGDHAAPTFGFTQSRKPIQPR